jgi:hypothetical protein
MPEFWYRSGDATGLSRGALTLATNSYIAASVSTPRDKPVASPERYQNSGIKPEWTNLFKILRRLLAANITAPVASYAAQCYEAGASAGLGEGAK